VVAGSAVRSADAAGSRACGAGVAGWVACCVPGFGLALSVAVGVAGFGAVGFSAAGASFVAGFGAGISTLGGVTGLGGGTRRSTMGLSGVTGPWMSGAAGGNWNPPTPSAVCARAGAAAARAVAAIVTIVALETILCHL